jgi:arylsulfatase A-like enzyme
MHGVCGLSSIFRRHRRALVLLLVLAAAALPFGPVRGSAGAGVAAAAQDTTPAAGEDASPFPGYWLVGPDGGVFSFGGANFYGSTGNRRLNQPVVGLAPTRTGDGYWFVATDGGIFSFGNAAFYGSTGAMKLNQPIVGMATTPTGWGYWLVASDGGIFSFGDARFYGSTGGMKLNRPIVGMAPTPTGKGYWLVASDGGIFSFGDARFFGSTGAIKLNQPITGMGTTPTGDGYWLVAADGGLFSYGDATFWGSAAGKAGANRIVGVLPSQTGAGYWEVSNTGEIFAFGDAKDFGSAPRPNHGVVGGAGVPTGAGLPVLPVSGGAAGSGDNGPTASTPAPIHPPVAPSPGSLPAGKAKPNILFILLDDARSEGVMDQPGVLPKTKRWLAQAGTTFDQGYSTTSLCCPERATIWSGRLPHNHQVVDNYSGDNLDHDWISPRYLQDAGYRTALVGKFITDWTFRYEPPHFDQYAAFQGGYVNTPFWVKDPGDTNHKWVTAPYSTDFIADKAVQYIDGFSASGSQPWFMQVSPHAPHNNMEATKTACDINALYNWPARDNNVATPPWQPSPAVTVEGDSNTAAKADKVPYVRNNTFPSSCGQVTYDGQLKTLLSVDDMVDRMMTELQKNGQLDHTMVILTSDNGFAHGDRGLTSKGMPYTEHVKVPFMVRWDGVFQPGAIDVRPVGGEDFLPTYLDAAQYTPPQLRYALDGKSFLPGRPGKDVKFLEFGPVGRPTPTGYKGHRGIPTWASIRGPDWHYIEYYDADNVTVSFREYYDLRADPWELNNLLADNNPSNDPDVVALSTRLHHLWTCVGTTGPNPCP